MSCQLDKSFYGRLFFVCLYACKRSRLGAVTAEHETFLSSETLNISKFFAKRPRLGKKIFFDRAFSTLSPDAVAAVPAAHSADKLLRAP